MNISVHRVCYCTYFDVDTIVKYESNNMMSLSFTNDRFLVKILHILYDANQMMCKIEKQMKQIPQIEHRWNWNIDFICDVRSPAWFDFTSLFVHTIEGIDHITLKLE